MFGAESETLTDPSAERVRNFYQANRERLVALLESGRQDGSLGFPGDIQATASLVFSLLEGGMLVARVQGGATQFHQDIEQLLRLLKG
jgi:TetR/AcrR family transcriptional repressor of nem operon